MSSPWAKVFRFTGSFLGKSEQGMVKSARTNTSNGAMAGDYRCASRRVVCMAEEKGLAMKDSRLSGAGVGLVVGLAKVYSVQVSVDCGSA